jgi:hypothetical protein
MLAACGRVGFDGLPDARLDGATLEPPDLVLHAAFDDDGLLLDRARGHELRCSSCPTPIAGKIAGAAMFDGGNCITVTDAVDLRPTTFSLAAWFSLIGTDGTIIGLPFNGLTEIHNTWMLYLGGGSWRFEYNRTDALVVATTPDNTWHHIAGTYDGTALTLYIDGSVAAGPMPVAPPQYASDEIMIGCDRDTGTNVALWQGLLDDVRLYSRALSAQEVAEMAAM